MHRVRWCAGKLEAKSCRSVGIALLEAISELVPGLQAPGMRPSKSSKVRHSGTLQCAAWLPSSQADGCHMHSVQYRPPAGLGFNAGLLFYRPTGAFPSLAAPLTKNPVRMYSIAAWHPAPGTGLRLAAGWRAAFRKCTSPN